MVTVRIRRNPWIYHKDRVPDLPPHLWLIVLDDTGRVAGSTYTIRGALSVCGENGWTPRMDLRQGDYGRLPWKQIFRWAKCRFWTGRAFAPDFTS